MLNFKPDAKEIDKIKNFTKKEKDFRVKNLQNFNSVGFPNKKNEDWKFLDLNNIISKNFNKLHLTNKIFEEKKINYIKEFEHNFVVLTNGKLTDSNFKFEDPKKISIKSYSNETFPKVEINNPLVSLNHALSNHGFKLEIEDNYKFKKILVVYNLYTEELNENILNSKNEIKIGKNSELHILDYIVNKSKKNFFSNIYENLILKESSIFKNIVINNEKNCGYFHKYSKNTLFSKANYSAFVFPSGLKFNKLDFEFDLLGKDCECNLKAASLLHKGDQQEIKTRINHLTPNCKSYQKVKNVLDKESKGIYQGKIYVKDVAQKTDAYQLSKAILLSEDSEFNSKPELEIYADDVKCSHGSTSGNIDQDSIYYLMTRGLSKKESTKLLINGFLSEIIETLKSKSIKEFIQNKLNKQIYEY